MEKFVIEGGRPLKGEVKISGSKNAALPILAATLLTDQTCVIRNVPKLRDTYTMGKLLRSLGKNVEINNDKITITSNGVINHVADYKLVSTMRGSFCVLGPLLAKLGKAKVSLPGGCVIGIRPVDLHLKGIKELGAKLEIENGYVTATAIKLKGANMFLGGVFGSSVLATANIMMAATLAHGQTVIECAACEPEVEDLTNMLIAMGAHIEGKGSPRLIITGVKQLRGADYKIIPDRIEAGTYILLAAATRSPLTIKNINPSHLMAVIDKLTEIGVEMECTESSIKVK